MSEEEPVGRYDTLQKTPGIQGSLAGWLWFFANAIGVSIGLMLSTAIGILRAAATAYPPGLDTLTPAEMVAMMAVHGIMIGIAVGLAECLIVRRVVRPGWWLLASCLGWTTGLACAELIMQRLSPGDFSAYLSLRVVGGALAALILGGSQWLVLRKSFRGAGWWCLVTFAGGLISFWIIQPSVMYMSDVWWAVGIPLGALTAPVMVWLLKRPRQSLQNELATATR